MQPAEHPPEEQPIAKGTPQVPEGVRRRTPAATQLATPPRKETTEDRSLSELAAPSAEAKVTGSTRYRDPSPSRWLMDLMTPFNRAVMLQGIPVLRKVPLINKIPIVRGLLKVRDIDFPKEDQQRLQSGVSKESNAFLAPNHPEFFSDWIVDKEVSARVSPYVASWADHGLVNMNPLLRAFWMRNNLVANLSETRGGRGKQYSLSYVKTGNGVLLHPEGSVHWDSKNVRYLFPGVADMARQAAQETAGVRPTYICPFVSRSTFTKDVTGELHKEMGYVEKRLDLPEGSAESPVETRFFALQMNILERREEEFGLEAPHYEEQFDIFTRQARLYEHLDYQIRLKYGSVEGTQAQQVARYRKVLKRVVASAGKSPETKEDLAKLDEMERLLGFNRRAYDHPRITQEDIAESLKRIQRDVVNFKMNPKKGIFRKLVDMQRKLIPIPIAKRDLHIRACDPIDVAPTAELDSPALTRKLHQSMQSRLNELSNELEDSLHARSYKNPFHYLAMLPRAAD